MLDIMRRNIILNHVSPSVSVAELNWSCHVSSPSFSVLCLPASLVRGQPLPETSMPLPDLILAADCVYLEDAFAPLVQTLSDLSTEHTEILFCYQKRRKADKRFFALLKKQFSWTDASIPPS
jgi:protein N-lysine methyltransferase METTL21A